jgi:hypothetical protein
MATAVVVAGTFLVGIAIFFHVLSAYDILTYLLHSVTVEAMEVEAVAMVEVEATEEAVRVLDCSGILLTSQSHCVVALCVNGSYWQVLTDHFFIFEPSSGGYDRGTL